jgi:hypothetical protein
MKGGNPMNLYNVETTFDILKRYKITSHKESVRRWLREGVLKGIPPAFRREGWIIREDDLYAFIQTRIPDETQLSNATNIVKEKREINEESIRAAMWWEIVRKNLFEGFIEVKKTQLHECIKHKGYSKEFETYVWNEMIKNKRGYATTRIPYLLEAYLFDSERILMDPNYESIEERIISSLIDYLRKKRTGTKK